MTHSVLHAIKARWSKPGAATIELDSDHFGRTLPPDKEGNNIRNVQSLIRLCEDIPHYVVTEDVINLAASDGCQKGFAAMNDAGVVNLPYDRVLIEWQVGGSFHQFCILSREPLIPTVYENVSAREAFWAYPFAYGKLLGSFTITASDLRSPMPVLLPDKGDPRGFYIVSEPGQDFTEDSRMLHQELAYISATGMCVSLLLVNTTGIEKVRVDNSHYDRKASKTGKPKMGSYTVLKIGHVYDKNGKAHAYTGRHMPVHIRAGHVRNQPYGPGRAKVKMIWINAVLVNYHPGDAVPVPHHEVTL